MRDATLAALTLLCLGCVLPTAFQVTQVPTPIYDPPVPLAFEGEARPELVATATPGLLAAPGVDPTLYYYEPWDRWFRHAFGQWYEAFDWNGNWFPPERVPGALKALLPHQPSPAPAPAPSPPPP